MRIYLVMDEFRFYHPNFIADFLIKTKDDIVGASLVTKIPPASNIGLYLKRHWYYLKLSEIAKLVLNEYSMALKDIFYKKRLNDSFYSVRSVFKYFNIDFIEVEYDINRKDYIEWIRRKTPDVIVSSNSLYFGEELLDAAKICCINRHASLLPSYGGIFPVFHAYRKGEAYIGVSMHVMGRLIDKGAIIAQRKIKINAKDSIADLYARCFGISADVLIEAIEKIRNNDFMPCSQENSSSFFSFPTRKHWQEFRKKKGRFI